MEQAGGTATDGANRILEIQPTELHQRVPFFWMGEYCDTNVYEREAWMPNWVIRMDAATTESQTDSISPKKQITSILQKLRYHKAINFPFKISKKLLVISD